jgi:hypothetical protein
MTMETRIRNSTGALMLLSGFPVLGQEAASKSASAVGYSVCPKVECSVVTPQGPDLLIAVAAFGIGLVAGAALTKVLGSKRRQ